MNKISIQQVFKLITFRGLGVALQVLMQFAIARVGGAAAIGLMQIYQTWTCVLGETTALGLPTQTMKSVSLDSESNTIVLRIKRSLRTLFLAWLVVAGLAVIASFTAPNWISFSIGSQLALLWSVLCFAVLRVSAEALKAMNHSTEAVLSENAIVPLLVTVFCLLLVANGIEPAEKVMGMVPIGEALIYAASVFLTLSTVYSLTCCLINARNKFVNAEPKRQTSLSTMPEMAVTLFTGETRFFWGTAILSIAFLNLPFLLMPWFGSVEEIGLFALAFKCINPISTILIMLGAIFGPRFAQAFCRDRGKKKLRSLLWQSQLISVGLYLPILLPILFFAESILVLFGDEFRDAKIYLFILAAAQLVNALTGLSGNMLNMVGLGKTEFHGSLIFCGIAIFLGIWAGTVYGLEGVAITYSAALAGKNLWSYFFALKVCGAGSQLSRLSIKPQPA